MGQMKKTKYDFALPFLMAFVLMFPLSSIDAKEKIEPKKPFDVPDHVFNIAKDNTFPNSTEDQEMIEPSKLTKSMITEQDIPIENPILIKLLNETTLKPSPLAIGYRGMIFLGRWPLAYESNDTTINWNYQQVNMNELNNRGGEIGQVMYYNQIEKKEVKGALTNKITNAADIQNMILHKVKEKTKLPLSFETIVGEHTKLDNAYNIPINKHGVIKAYAPAVNEKGQATFGEVYIELKGKNKAIVIKNVTKQGVGAWIPIQDHISLAFQLK